jgi:hypothetical protein
MGDNASTYMKKIYEHTQAELNELFRRACEGLLAEGLVSPLVMVQQSLVDNRSIVKRALRARASISSLRKHLEVVGVKCSNDCLRVALTRVGLRRAKSPKGNRPKPGKPNGDNAP